MSTIELLVVLVLVVVVGLGLLRSLTWTSDQLFSRTDVALASAVQAQHAMDLIRRDLNHASGSQGLACGQNLLAMRINGTPVIYFHPTDPNSPIWNTLQRQAGVAPPQTVTGGITALETNCAMPGMVTVGLNARVRKASFVANQSLTTKVALHNP